MKILPYVVLATFVVIPLKSPAAQTAQARLYCTSIKINHGINEYGDTFDINNTGFPNGAGELCVWWSYPIPEISLPGPGDYVSQLWLFDSLYQEYDYGSLSLFPPPPSDVNNNKFADFFEVSRSVNAQSSGSYSAGLGGSGTITATWVRSVGSSTGNYTFAFDDPYWGTFHGTFQILEYNGTVSYAAGSNLVSGNISLTQAGSPANTLQGSVQFAKTDTNRFDALTIRSGTWADGSAQNWYYTNHYFFRDTGWPTNYAGYIEFDDDYDVNTIYPYSVWVLSINDTNDKNQNGIPDFSDDPQTVTPPPRQPQLSVAITSTNVLLTVRGDVSHVHQIQEVSSLDSTSWQTVASLTLTNDPVVIPLPLSPGSRFWRVQAQ